MSKNIVNFLRFFDVSEAPVSLSYNRKDAYSSTVGGFCSFMMILAVTAFCSYESYKLFSSPDIKMDSVSS